MTFVTSGSSSNTTVRTKSVTIRPLSESKTRVIHLLPLDGANDATVIKRQRTRRRTFTAIDLTPHAMCIEVQRGFVSTLPVVTLSD